MALSYILCALTVFLIGARTVQVWNRLPLPPGPKGRYPLLGMTFDMPKQKPWEQFAEWAK
jgi:hypothetical protein